MEQTLTAKIRILVSPEHEQILQNTMNAFADGCNYVSEYIFQSHDLNRGSVHRETYYPLRSLFGLRSQMAVSCIRTVIGKYRSVLTSQKAWIKPVFRHPQLDLVWNRDYCVNLKKDLFSVNTLIGRIQIPFVRTGCERFFSGDFRFGTAKLIRRKGKYYLYVSVTAELTELQKSEVTNVVGIDRGIRFLAVTYDSSGKTEFFSGNPVKQKRAHYQALRRQLQQVGTPSSRRRLKSIGQRENRWMRDVDHCISKALVEHNPEGTMFVIEDLTGIRAATERVRVKDRYVSVSWPYYDLEQKLSYKARMHRQLVEKVSPAYTSQTCPKCGHTEQGNRNKETHSFRCRNCGYQSNDDRIGAMKLHLKGKQIIQSDAVAAE